MGLSLFCQLLFVVVLFIIRSVLACFSKQKGENLQQSLETSPCCHQMSSADASGVTPSLLTGGFCGLPQVSINSPELHPRGMLLRGAAVHRAKGWHSGTIPQLFSMP